MELNGKYIGIWVTHEELEAILGLDPSSLARVFMIGGKVVGETAGIGLWIQLEFVSEGEPANNLFSNLPKEQRLRLVRWEYIRAAEMFNEKPAMERAVGFQPQAA